MNYPPAVTKRLNSVLPESIRNEITAICFTHNCSKSDIAVTTKHGELIEFKDRIVVSSIIFQSNLKIKQIILHRRNNISDHSYILQGDDCIFIVGHNKKNNLKILQHYSDVTKMDINDTYSNGNVKIMLWFYDEAIPVSLNEDYEKEAENHFDVNKNEEKEDVMFVALLNRKLAEAKLNTAENLKTLEEKRKYRQELMYLIEDDSRLNRGGIEQQESLQMEKLHVGNIWQRIFNGNWIIGVPLENLSKQSLEEIQVLLKSDEFATFYDTQIYTEVSGKPPFWTKKLREPLNEKDKVTMVIVASQPEFEECATKTVTGALRYKYNREDLSLPLPDTIVKVSSIINGELDPVLRNDENFDSRDFLAILSTSVQTDLDIYYIDGSKSINLETFFVENLKFTFDPKLGIFRHSVSPMNILHGVAIYIIQNKIENFSQIVLFSRSENQALMFVNLIYDLLPLRCVIVPSGFVVTAKQTGIKINLKQNIESMDGSFEMTDTDSIENILTDYMSVMNQQMSYVSTHLEKCIEEMSRVNNRNTQQNDCSSSINIDVTALGVEKYQELWSFLKEKMIARRDIILKMVDCELSNIE